MIAALYVLSNGPYFGLEGIDPWGESRDARLYRGPHRVIAHPPCERWGRYWGGGPMLHGTERQKLLGDDAGCFAHAVWCVRQFGGIVEHPEASHAFHFWGLPIPKQSGGWTEPDRYGGRSCCVAQGAYGHKAQKLTWLYGVGIDFLELKWGKTPGRTRLDMGHHSKAEREVAKRTGERLSTQQNLETPEEFKQLLIRMVKP